MVNLTRIQDEHPDVYLFLQFHGDFICFIAEYEGKRASKCFSYTQLEQIMSPELIEEELIRLCKSLKRRIELEPDWFLSQN